MEQSSVLGISQNLAVVANVDGHYLLVLPGRTNLG